ncbi:MAG: tetratricopeptide repeat protein [Bacteroidota bacterium]
MNLTSVVFSLALTLCYFNCLSQNPYTRFNIYQDLAFKKYQDRDFESARSTLRKMNELIIPLRDDEIKAEAYREINKLYGAINQQEENWDSAAYYFTQAIKYDKKDVNNYMQRADSYLKLFEYEKAIEDIKIILEREPANARYHYQLSYAYQGLGLLEKSMQYLNSCVDLGFSQAVAVEWVRALNYIGLQQNEKALSVVEDALIKNLGFSDNFTFLKGELLFLKGNKEALKIFEKMSSNDELKAFRLLASVYINEECCPEELSKLMTPEDYQNSYWLLKYYAANKDIDRLNAHFLKMIENDLKTRGKILTDPYLLSIENSKFQELISSIRPKD